MLVPVALYAKNFRLLHDVTWFIPRDLVFVAGVNCDVPGASSNMSGKTTLLNVVPFVTHGVDLTGKSIAASCVSDGATYCTAGLVVVDDQTLETWLYVRGRNEARSGAASGSSLNTLEWYSLNKQPKPGDSLVRLMVDGTRHGSGPAAQYQHHFDAVFGSVELFLASHVFGVSADAVPFACKGDREQKRLFDLLIDNADLEAGEAGASADVARLSKEHTKVEAQLETHVAELKNIREKLRATAVWRSDVCSVAEASNRVLLVKRKYLVPVVALQKKLTKAASEVAALQKEDATLQRQLADADAVYAEAKRKARLAIPAVSAVCPTCGGALSQQRVDEMADAATKALIAAEAFARQAKVDRDGVGKQSVAVGQRLQYAMKREAEAAAKLQRAERTLAPRIAAAEKVLRAAEDAEKTAKVERGVWVKARGEKKRSILDARKRLRIVAAELDSAKFWQRAFGPKGIRAFRLAQVTPILNSYAAAYSDALFGDGMKLVYSTSKTLANGKESECFDAALFDAHGTRCAVVSAGQGMRRDLVHTFSIVRLAQALGKRSMNLLVMDEMFQALDALGIEGVVNVLHALGDELGTIAVVEHNDELQTHFKNVVTVERKNGCSSVG